LLTTGGGYGYGLIVDPENKLAESNENNNTWAKPVTNPYASNQYNLADLVIDRIYFSDNTSFRGDIDMHVVIRNQGSRRAVLCSALRTAGDFLWKSNNPLSAHANDNNLQIQGYSYHVLLEPGQAWDSARYRVNVYNIPGGSYLMKDITHGCYTFSVEINPNGTIPEANRANNTATAFYSTDNTAKCLSGPQAYTPGIKPGHAYTALATVTVDGKTYFVAKNPWGSSETEPGSGSLARMQTRPMIIKRDSLLEQEQQISPAATKQALTYCRGVEKSNKMCGFTLAPACPEEWSVGESFTVAGREYRACIRSQVIQEP
jgi:hypothetical protein